jgi:hypothetical protein
MIRTAIYGPLDESSEIAAVLQGNPLCSIGGWCSPRRNEQSTHLIDHPWHVYSSFNSLIENSDCVLFPEPASVVYDKIVLAIRRSRHVFVQPDTNFSTEALTELQKLAEEAGVLLYLRHNTVNSKLKDTLKKYCNRPEYIDSYAYIDTGGNHNPEVVKNMLYTEITFVLSLSQAACRRFFITSVPYCTDEALLFNVRIEFTNGSAANLTLNNYLSENARFTEVYSKNGMMRIDSKTETIAIVQRTPDVKQAIKLPGLRDAEAAEELGTFFSLIESQLYSANPSGSGILLHHTTMEILRRLFPQKVHNRTLAKG